MNSRSSLSVLSYRAALVAANAIAALVIVFNAPMVSAWAPPSESSRCADRVKGFTEDDVVRDAIPISVTPAKGRYPVSLDARVTGISANGRCIEMDAVPYVGSGSDRLDLTASDVKVSFPVYVLLTSALEPEVEFQVTLHGWEILYYRNENGVQGYVSNVAIGAKVSGQRVASFGATKEKPGFQATAAHRWWLGTGSAGDAQVLLLCEQPCSEMIKSFDGQAQSQDTQQITCPLASSDSFVIEYTGAGAAPGSAELQELCDGLQLECGEDASPPPTINSFTTFADLNNHLIRRCVRLSNKHYRLDGDPSFTDGTMTVKVTLPMVKPSEIEVVLEPAQGMDSIPDSCKPALIYTPLAGDARTFQLTTTDEKSYKIAGVDDVVLNANDKVEVRLQGPDCTLGDRVVAPEALAASYQHRARAYQIRRKVYYSRPTLHVVIATSDWEGDKRLNSTDGQWFVEAVIKGLASSEEVKQKVRTVELYRSFEQDDNQTLPKPMALRSDADDANREGLLNWIRTSVEGTQTARMGSGHIKRFVGKRLENDASRPASIDPAHLFLFVGRRVEGSPCAAESDITSVNKVLGDKKSRAIIVELYFHDDLFIQEDKDREQLVHVPVPDAAFGPWRCKATGANADRIDRVAFNWDSRPRGGGNGDAWRDGVVLTVQALLKSCAMSGCPR